MIIFLYDRRIRSREHRVGRSRKHRVASTIAVYDRGNIGGSQWRFVNPCLYLRKYRNGKRQADPSEMQFLLSESFNGSLSANKMRAKNGYLYRAHCEPRDCSNSRFVAAVSFHPPAAFRAACVNLTPVISIEPRSISCSAPWTVVCH